MSVLVEALTLVVPKHVLDASYPGGTDAFLQAALQLAQPPRFVCSGDAHLVNLSFYDSEHLDPATALLHQHAIVGVDVAERRSIEYVCVDQACGPTMPCDWIEWTRHRDGFSYAWLAGTERGDMAAPSGWTPEQSRQCVRSDVRDDPSRMLHLATEGELETWLDLETGRQVIGLATRAPDGPGDAPAGGDAAPPPPIPNAYWIPGTRILAGEYPGALDPRAARAKVGRLLEGGVTCFVDLTRAHELHPYVTLLRAEAAGLGREVEHVRLPIGDMGVPTTRDMARILDVVDAAVPRTRPRRATRALLPARDRLRGALVGLAVGDAVGTTVEFQAPGSFAPVTNMVGGGPFCLAPGQWTDDTAMALCLAESLIECRGFDAADQMRRYVRWWREGHLSSTGRCFDIGTTTRRALAAFERSGEPYSGPEAPDTAGNGSLMRLAPLAIFDAHRFDAAFRAFADGSRTTHGARVAVDACRYLGALLLGAFHGASKAELLAPRYTPLAGYWDAHPLCPEVATVADGSFRRKQPPAIRGTGYAAASLEAALWAFHAGATFREGCLLAVNLGGDADTTAAVYGQLAGAFHGEQAIPAEWREKLALWPVLDAYAEALYRLSEPDAPRMSPAPSGRPLRLMD